MQNESFLFSKIGIMYEVYLRVSHLFPEYLDGQSQTKPAAVSLHTPRRQGGGESLHLITANNQEHVSININK